MTLQTSQLMKTINKFRGKEDCGEKPMNQLQKTIMKLKGKSNA